MWVGSGLGQEEVVGPELKGTHLFWKHSESWSSLLSLLFLLFLSKHLSGQNRADGQSAFNPWFGSPMTSSPTFRFFLLTPMLFPNFQTMALLPHSARLVKVLTALGCLA